MLYQEPNYLLSQKMLTVVSIQPEAHFFIHHEIQTGDQLFIFICNLEPIYLLHQYHWFNCFIFLIYSLVSNLKRLYFNSLKIAIKFSKIFPVQTEIYTNQPDVSYLTVCSSTLIHFKQNKNSTWLHKVTELKFFSSVSFSSKLLCYHYLFL